MSTLTRKILRIVAVSSLLSAGALWWYSRKTQGDAQALARGEEVYASHDCTDCHLAAHALRQKRERGEPGLIRVRRSLPEIRQFLEGDQKHRSYVMMTQNDRDDLVVYLRSLLPQ
jgi:mono/diheme cytochrome c family protein